jgi:hypothetical protein
VLPDDGFTVEIGGPALADVFLSCSEEHAVWPLIQRLDRSRLCVVGDVPPVEGAASRAADIAAACAGVVAVLPPESSSPDSFHRIAADVRRALAYRQPVAVFHEHGRSGVLRAGTGTLTGAGIVHGPSDFDDGDACFGTAVDRFAAEACRRSRARPYAFFIGRLERDFTHARVAIRSAVEREAGMPCVWSDSGHQTNVASVRESTRLLIRNAEFVIADLTLGVESPERENPSRAHEIGMSIAYERPLLLCSQDPRRYPYFSIGDMQMTFWTTEAQLHDCVRDWIRARRGTLARRVFNHRLTEAFPGYQPLIDIAPFEYDPRQRYVGPKTPPGPGD